MILEVLLLDTEDVPAIVAALIFVAEATESEEDRKILLKAVSCMKCYTPQAIAEVRKAARVKLDAMLGR